MTDPGIVVVGEERLVSTMRALADNVEHLEPAHEAAGELILAKAGPRTPRQSGQLAASGRVDADSSTTGVVYDEVYAGVVHNGDPDRNITPQPWLLETIQEQTVAVVGVFGDYLQDLVDQVKGA